MKTTIFIEDSFDSAHYLPNVPSGHKCKRLHGHTYRIRMEVGGEVNQNTGWIIDYADVRRTWDSVKLFVDHRCLNEVEGLENPTCENLGAYLLHRLRINLPNLVAIELRETEHCGVRVEVTAGSAYGKPGDGDAFMDSNVDIGEQWR